MHRIRTFTIAVATILCAIAVATFAQCGGDPAASAPGASDPTPDSPAAQTPPEQPAPAEAARQVVGERLRLLLSGSMEGRLEPCGCASGQLGGLARRMMHAQEMRGYDLLLEGGNMVEGDTPLDVAKAETVLQVLFMMPELTALLRGLPQDSTLVGPYHALGIGPHDLQLPMEGYWSNGLPSAFEMPLVASDLQSTAGGWPARSFVEHTVRGTLVRIASLTMSLPAAVQQAEPAAIQLLEPTAAWQRAMLGCADDTRRIVMIHAAPKQVQELAATLRPRPDLVIGVNDTFHEPPSTESAADGVPIVYPGIRGRVMLAVTIARTADGGSAITQYEPVPLRGSETKPGAGQDPTVRQIILGHRHDVAAQGIQEAMADQRPTASGHAYVGSTKCASCHVAAFEAWQTSKHARAWETLVQAEQDPSRYGWPVTQYPDCVSCHVVGHREQSGFITYEKTPDLAGVGCERCHGPGSAHSDKPFEVKMGKVGAGLPSRVCTECHDFEQSPDFDYGKRWPLIDHGK